MKKEKQIDYFKDMMKMGEESYFHWISFKYFVDLQAACVFWENFPVGKEKQFWNCLLILVPLKRE